METIKQTWIILGPFCRGEYFGTERGAKLQAKKYHGYESLTDCVTIFDNDGYPRFAQSRLTKKWRNLNERG